MTTESEAQDALAYAQFEKHVVCEEIRKLEKRLLVLETTEAMAKEVIRRERANALDPLQ